MLIALAVASCCGGGSSKSCSKDTDCKGNRVCVDGTCEKPAAPPAPVAARPPPQQQRPAPANNARVATVIPPPQNRNGVVRSTPSFSAMKVAELPRGTQVTVLQYSADRLWRHVRWNVNGAVGEGWIHQDVLAE